MRRLNWIRANEEEGLKTYESWAKMTNSEFIGVGYTLQNSDTIWKENVRLVGSTEGWNYEVTGQGEIQPTIFKLTSVEEDSFLSENEANEFPKK